MFCSINNWSINLRYHGFELLMLIRGAPNRSKTPPTSSMSLNEASRLATTPLTLKLMVNIPIVLAMSTRPRAQRRSHLTFMGSCMCPSRRWLQIRWKLRVCLLFRFVIGLELMWEWNLVKALFQLVSQVKDEQQYIIMRERTHRNTAESTNARVKWWSIFQLGVLLGEGVFQVWWLKRFFEVGSIRNFWRVAPLLIQARRSSA